MGPDARRANIRSVLITDVHISGANCILDKMTHQECNVNLEDLLNIKTNYS